MSGLSFDTEMRRYYDAWGYPGEELEERLLSAFMSTPRPLLDWLNRMLPRAESGEVFAPWKLVDSKLEDEMDRHKPKKNRPDVIAQGHDLAISRAKQWIVNAGVHFDRESELVDELFGQPRSSLYALRDDKDVVDSMVELWYSQRALVGFTDDEYGAKTGIPLAVNAAEEGDQPSAADEGRSGQPALAALSLLKELS